MNYPNGIASTLAEFAFCYSAFQRWIFSANARNGTRRKFSNSAYGDRTVMDELPPTRKLLQNGGTSQLATILPEPAKRGRVDAGNATRSVFVNLLVVVDIHSLVRRCQPALLERSIFLRENCRELI